MKPIVHITTPPDMEPEQMEAISEYLGIEGYLTLFTSGDKASIKILSAKRMKRSDYQACVNAAKKAIAK